MYNKLLLGLALTGLFAFEAQAEGSSASLYIEDARIAPGTTATLSLQLTNDFPVQGYEFCLTLPEGLSMKLEQSLSAGRMPENITPIPASNQLEGNVYKFAMVMQASSADQDATFAGSSGEIATLTLVADASVAEGEYTVSLTDTSVGNDKGEDIPVDGTSFTITVGAIEYAEGYSVEILPFAYDATTQESGMPFLMTSATDITNVAFDAVLPPAFVDENLGVDAILATRKYETVADVKSDGTIHVTVDRRSTNTIEAGEDTEIGLLYFTVIGTIPEGVYPISIKNITLTDADGKSYMVAPYSTEIFVGDAPKVTATDGVAAFHGNYGETATYALLKASLPEGATIDLTEVSATAEDPTTLKTDNVIVTSDAVAYGRSVSNEWGSLCLPFSIESDDNIQLYELTGVSSSALTFSKITSAPANTPLIFKATGSDFSVKQDNDGSFNVGFAAENPGIKADQDVANWVINGVYAAQTIDVSSLQAYALNGGEFHRVTSKIEAKAFRAWLQNNGEALNAALRIIDSTEGIDFIEQEDGTVNLIYDLYGRRSSKDGSKMIIENGMKKYNK